MKTSPLVRWCLALAITGSSLLGSARPTIALPEQEVATILNTVPVFTLVDARERLVLATIPGGSRFQAVFYVDARAAQDALAKLQREQPERANRVRIVSRSMGTVFQLARSQRAQANSPVFTFVADRDQVQEAEKLLAKSGQQPIVNDVPLFVATNPDGSYLSIPDRNGQARIPFFFELEELEDRLDDMRKSQPAAAGAVDITVVPLNTVIETLLESNDANLRSVYLFPSREAVNSLSNFQ